ncbi:PP2C family protein-serine/threonine phosphatase [Thermoactinospora rubra]|uniref:PP2C family protein-serine/threonine phosphatase n=1 Tax=Thermoactinospora rubra TaxID=1088767 RepID=UPI000A10ABEE|nr:PP2C family protein-serine/threonine phosphatase [Thermoactinospora rubra]
MVTREGLYAVRQAIQDAPPYAVAEALRDALSEHFGHPDIEVLLADYAKATLRPVLNPLSPGSPGLSIDTTEAGRAFAAQQPQLSDGGRLLHLPVTAFGERFGVLNVRLPEESAPEALELLQEVAVAFAHALRGADLITDRYQQVRRLARFTLAAEMQWELLPGSSHEGDGYRLAGQLEPAYAVYGDNFDWACGPRWLMMSVTNGMGQGISAALLTSLAITALRNARRSGAGLEEQAGLADEAIFAEYGGERYVSTLLLRFDAATGDLALVDAGSPLLLLMRGGKVSRIELDKQLPLGMFGNTAYVEQQMQLRPGDRLVIVSDGVYSSRSASGQEFSGAPLEGVVKATRLQPADEAVRTMIRGLLDFRNGSESIDDAVVVCLDWVADAASQLLPAAPEEVV